MVEVALLVVDDMRHLFVEVFDEQGAFLVTTDGLLVDLSHFLFLLEDQVAQLSTLRIAFYLKGYSLLQLFFDAR